MAKRLTRRRLLISAGVIAGASALTFPYVATRIHKPDDVFFILSDALRGDAIGKVINGRAVTPNLNALAAQSVYFPRAFSAAPATKYSVASLFSGMYPPGHGVEHHVFALPDCLTIPSFLASKGFTTAALVTNRYLLPEIWPANAASTLDFGFNRSFDKYLVLDIKTGNGAPPRGQRLDPHVKGPALTSAFLRLLDRIKQPRFFGSPPPLFAYLHYMDTHQPWLQNEPMKDITGIFHPPDSRSVSQVYDDDVRVISRVLFDLVPRQDLSPEDMSTLKAIYYEAAAYADACFGNLLAELKTRGLYDSATIIFTADHGDEFMEHGEIGHTKNLFNTSLHVPLMIKSPTLTPATIPARVSNVAILPTIMDLLFGEEMQSNNVYSLMPYIDGGEKRNSDVFAGFFGLDKIIMPDGRVAMMHKDDTLYFDIDKDPGELLPLSPDPAVLLAMHKTRAASVNLAASLGIKRRFSTWAWQNPWAEAQDAAAMEHVRKGEISGLEAARLKSFGGFLPDSAQITLAGELRSIAINEAALSPQEADQLRSLGYLQ